MPGSQQTSSSTTEKSSSTGNTKTWNYLFRVLLSFVAVVLLLDVAWSRFSSQSSIDDAETYWQETFLTSAALLLNDAPPENYPSIAENLSQVTGLNVTIESLDQLHQQLPSSTLPPQSQLIDINHQRYLLATYPEAHMQIRFGPLPEESNWLSSLVTIGFYLVVALLIWIWLRPLVRGLDRLSEMTSKFAQNYQEPLPELKVRSPVKELANSIESMAAEIRLLLQTQVELTGGLSHEIRTPLARIKFALATARGEIGNRNQFDSIDRDLLELEQLVEAMLDYSRLQQTNAILNWQSIEATPFLEGISEKYQWRTRAKISVDMPELAQTKSPSLSLLGDERLIGLAISNLLVNATRYSQHQISVTFAIENNHQVLRVSDDGPGIPKENREQALQPFQKNTSTSGLSDGFGLGLAIVKRIAVLHNGWITLDESNLGGLEITFCWPLKQS